MNAAQRLNLLLQDGYEPQVTLHTLTTWMIEKDITQAREVALTMTLAFESSQYTVAAAASDPWQVVHELRVNEYGAMVSSTQACAVEEQRPIYSLFLDAHARRNLESQR